VTAVKRPVGAAQGQLARNLRELRKSRGMSTYGLARELKAIGWPIGASGITRLEAGERRASVDDVVALALCLNCSPNRLLFPEARGDLIPVAGDVKARDIDVWAWITGEKPLTVPGAGSELAGSELAVFKIQNQPHRYQG
jgi:transcriptional regulator with XRE-family HTH domain